MGQKKINTIEALNSIGIKASDLHDLCGDPLREELLLSCGIDPDHYYPKLTKSINEKQWLRLLIFYARKAGHPPAQNMLEAKIDVVKKELYL
jgi:hypothetical protein